MLGKANARVFVFDAICNIFAQMYLISFTPKMFNFALIYHKLFLKRHASAYFKKLGIQVLKRVSN